jgi:UDP-N-acetylmuramoylalanine--D-glutamate ligase
VAALAAQGLELVRRLDSVNADWAVVSPGIPDAHPTVVTLRRRGVRVVDELDFAARFVPGPLVAVTGTNGKSTTTTLIARILAASGRRVFSGGNLAPGRPLSCGLGRTQYDSYVVEVSSFQLARAQWLRPKVAVLLNITPDHLNRHRTMAAYAESKLRILDRQTRDDFVVLNRDDGRVWQARARGRGMKRAFSVRHRTGAAYLADGILWCLGHKVIPRDLLALPGEHNVANALAACLAAGLLGASPDAMRRVLESFHGLPHRLERVAVKGGVVFINNSMSTNPAAAVSSLAAVAQARPVVLIAGGREKGLPVDDHLAAIERQAKWVVLTGENRQHLARSLQQRGFTRWSTSANLRAAVRVARRKARPGDAVLFSPGFASFDQFRDFQERGEEFRSAVLDNTGAEDSRKPARRRRS